MKFFEYTSCNIIEHGFDAQINQINLCCRTSKDNIDKYTLIDNYHGQKIDWDDFFRKTNRLREIQKSGNTVPSCEGCIYLEKKLWNDENYINTININNWIKCNANCIYCDRSNFVKEKEYKIYPIIKDLINKNLLKNPADITIAGGEPTITSDFDKTIKILVKNNISTIRVLTNAIKYNKNIELGLKKGLVNILISTDSATKDTYKKIKLTDAHNKVWKNIAKYVHNQAQDDLVKTKYIIITGINDNQEELNEFVKLNAASGVKYAYVDIEVERFMNNINNIEYLKRLYELYLNAKATGEKYGVKIQAFDRMKIAKEKIK